MGGCDDAAADDDAVVLAVVVAAVACGRPNYDPPTFLLPPPVTHLYSRILLHMLVFQPQTEMEFVLHTSLMLASFNDILHCFFE